ncbi:MAG: aminopeptidase [Candidatus Hodarchaeales archaeon]|jgi:leucyl aminopeptidase (aminopeptidase T)
MFDCQDYFKAENVPIIENYEKSLAKIEAILNEIAENKVKVSEEKQPYYAFFEHTAKFILRLTNLEKVLSEDYFETKGFDELFSENNELYEDLIPENYSKSYANPSYSVEIFGDQLGQLMSYFYCRIKEYIDYAYSHRIFMMEEYNRAFIEAYQLLKDEKLNYDRLKEIVIAPRLNPDPHFLASRGKERYDPQYRFKTEIIENADLTDLRYLFRTGHYISEKELRIARFLNQYPDSIITDLARQVVKAYIKSFKLANKDISTKSVVALFYKAGMEKFFREVIKEFRKRKLESTIMDERSYLTPVNKQYGYDHRFDDTLYLDEDWCEMALKRFEEAFELNKDLLPAYSGDLFTVMFGEPLFSPETKEENLKLTANQTALFQQFNGKIMQAYFKYIPPPGYSQCIVSFPTPEIGENFEEIFEDIIEINMLDSTQYEHIQQQMIDLLDQADRVHVRGKAGNETDLFVKLQEIKNLETETNFANSGTGVNIPVGEVYTTPQLTGTTGVLHVEETYQDNYRYDNLRLVFKDGYVDSYSCTNFENDEENKKYIEENLLFPYKTLPMGEFAIGTNTLAYKVANKYNIMDVLPVLIKEKTGPHIAIGDCLFSNREDLKAYNQLNGKEITAIENEKTALRKTNPSEAYTQKHTDITLAFDSLDFITAIKRNGEQIDIIKDGKFVLAGTEELNGPLE